MPFLALKWEKGDLMRSQFFRLLMNWAAKLTISILFKSGSKKKSLKRHLLFTKSYVNKNSLADFYQIVAIEPTNSFVVEEGIIDETIITKKILEIDTSFNPPILTLCQQNIYLSELKELYDFLYEAQKRGFISCFCEFE